MTATQSDYIQCRFSKYDFYAYALMVNRHFGSSLGVNEMQKTATFARGTFERYFDARRALYKLHQIPHRQEDRQREEQHHRTQRDDENGPDPFGQFIHGEVHFCVVVLGEFSQHLF